MADIVRWLGENGNQKLLQKQYLFSVFISFYGLNIVRKYPNDKHKEMNWSIARLQHTHTCAGSCRITPDPKKSIKLAKRGSLHNKFLDNSSKSLLFLNEEIAPDKINLSCFLLSSGHTLWQKLHFFVF